MGMNGEAPYASKLAADTGPRSVPRHKSRTDYDSGSRFPKA